MISIDAYKKALETLINIFLKKVIMVDLSALKKYEVMHAEIINDHDLKKEKTVTIEELTILQNDCENNLMALKREMVIYIIGQERIRRRNFNSLKIETARISSQFEKNILLSEALNLCSSFDVEFYKIVARTKYNLLSLGIIINFEYFIRSIYLSIYLEKIQKLESVVTMVSHLSNRTGIAEINMKTLVGYDDKPGHSYTWSPVQTQAWINLYMDLFNGVSDEDIINTYGKLKYLINGKEYSFSKFLDRIIQLDSKSIRDLCFNNYLKDLYSLRFTQKKPKDLPRPVAREIWPILKYFFPLEFPGIDKSFYREDVKRFLPRTGLNIEIFEIISG